MPQQLSTTDWKLKGLQEFPWASGDLRFFSPVFLFGHTQTVYDFYSQLNYLLLAKTSYVNYSVLEWIMHKLCIRSISFSIFSTSVIRINGIQKLVLILNISSPLWSPKRPTWGWIEVYRSHCRHSVVYCCDVGCPTALRRQPLVDVLRKLVWAANKILLCTQYAKGNKLNQYHAVLLGCCGQKLRRASSNHNNFEVLKNAKQVAKSLNPSVLSEKIK